MALHQKAEKIILLVEMMIVGQASLPCFKDQDAAIDLMKDRLYPLGVKKKLKTEDAKNEVNKLINLSYKNWGNRIYDQY